METAKLIEGYPGYEVTRDGKIISRVKYANGKIRKTHVNHLGYEKVVLVAPDLRRVTESVHRLVAIAFVPNPMGLPEVDHLDGVKTNNLPSNFEWVTHKENLRRARVRLGNWSASVGVKTRKPVIATDATTGVETVWASGRAFALATGNPHRAANVSKAIQTGGLSYGSHWRFARPEDRPTIVAFDDPRILPLKNQPACDEPRPPMTQEELAAMDRRHLTESDCRRAKQAQP